MDGYVFFFFLSFPVTDLKKINEKKKNNIGVDLKWAIAHLSIGAVSQYSHCIVTQWGWKVAGLKRSCIARWSSVLQ